MASNNNNNNLMNVREFFKNKSIFLTGATGFLGKALVEKLLSSCFDIEKIYILVRHKKGIDSSERLIEFFKNENLFKRLIRLHPDYEQKVTVIQGDLLQVGLGLSETDRKLLIDHVNIIFHSAATVRFNEPLKIAINTNIKGTKRVLELSKCMRNLQVFVHVSTAYANCDQSYITEEVYEPKIQPDKLIEATDWLDDEIIELLEPKIIKSMPNTYTFTKQITEYLVYSESKTPTVILRPSIVGASWLEPHIGWVDNFNGPTGLIQAHSMGILRCMQGTNEATADIIPVDVVINMMITSACYIFSSQKIQNSKSKLLVINCTSDKENCITWGMLEKMSNKLANECPCQELIFLPNFQFTKHRWLRNIRIWTEQLFPALIVDAVLRLLHKKPL